VVLSRECSTSLLFSKGGKLFLCVIKIVFTHTYVHRPKLWDRPVDFTEGTNKVKMILDRLDAIIIGENRENKKVKKIFTKRPAIKWDNYFSRDAILDYAKKRDSDCS